MLTYSENSTPITQKDLPNYKNKYVKCIHCNYKWIFKLLDIQNDRLVVTQGIDIYPQPRLYYGGVTDFNIKRTEPLYGSDALYTVTKQDMKLYRKFTREIIFLNSNKSYYGSK